LIGIATAAIKEEIQEKVGKNRATDMKVQIIEERIKQL
jgi:hypothetical protein